MNKLYPIDYVTYYDKQGKLPKEVKKSMRDTTKKGFHILELTPDRYDVPDKVKPYHAGFKHMKEITMPKFLKLRDENPNIKGFFIAEGDLCINEDYNFEKFLKSKYTKPIWLGYKKKLNDYIVGNFLIYIPVKYLDELNEHFQKKKILVYSDRFFTNLYNKGFLKLSSKSLAGEIEHQSKVKRGLRKSKCHIKLNKTKKNNLRNQNNK